VSEISQQYADGIAWGEMKKILFEKINQEISEARERYQSLMETPEHIEEQLQEGAKKAREISQPFMQEIRESIGISRISK
jgi:tryptophanyl-tRNA synthetase